MMKKRADISHTYIWQQFNSLRLIHSEELQLRLHILFEDLEKKVMSKSNARPSTIKISLTMEYDD